MDVLTVNAGSSSVRLGVHQIAADGVRARLALHHDASDDPAESIAATVQRAGGTPPAAVAHRVVHGGELPDPCRVDGAVAAEIERLARLAPLHNPVALRWLRAAQEVCGPAVPQVACFDTGFFRDLPTEARHYAIPAELARRHGIRRFGFHGLAHRFLWRRLADARPDLAAAGRAVTFQLGSGCSATALRGGRPLDTSMGFSPLEGLVMATRSGDVDPALVAFLGREEGLPPAAVIDLLNQDSGLRGVSGVSGRMEEVLAAGTPAARLAVALFCHRARRWLGGAVATLGGLDAVVFGGGVGENAPAVRAGILAGLECFGIVLDDAENARLTGGAEGGLGAPSAPVDVRVVRVDEAEELARAAAAVLGR